ncbi:MAG: Eco57I restriction-modification methylase domain-containing protein [Bacteroidales bacterium]|nr:Eco57I restriction-modification methylase domain-containing protein [Bacteroidales bacterium]
MLVFAARVGVDLSERSGKKKQYELGKRVLKNEARYAGGFFIFYDDGGNFRFSLIYSIPQFTGKVSYSNYRRYTYFVSRTQTNRTFIQQMSEADFSSLDRIIEAFSVEKVTRQFYQEVACWYFWAMDKVRFPDDYRYAVEEGKDVEIRNSTNLIRLLTRLIFIWFLRERGLVPKELFNAQDLERLVKDFYTSKRSSNYYNAILQNLFFGTLNQRMGERRFVEEGDFTVNRKEFGVKNLYRYADMFLVSREEVKALFAGVPFLNGGLFECLDKEGENGKVVYIDGFSRNEKKRAIVPDFLFFQCDEEKVNLTAYKMGQGKTVRGLIEILRSYNFTVDEASPVDQEVALDPEMLGKVFEELLASYNPETADTARKATGSFYTPREIVDYMVRQSLLQYFKTKTQLDESTLEHLLTYTDDLPQGLSEEEKGQLIGLIDQIKILDPACGSGAFPMGILHQLVFLLQKLDPENKHWYELQYNKALAETKEAFKHTDKNEREGLLKMINDSFDEKINYPDYARKLYLIENCIYGIDIQPIAVQISKLRFFISLVLDQKVDFTKENYGIRPLPNLETKFVAANTLIGLGGSRGQLRNYEVEELEARLKEMRHRYFTATSRPQKLRCQEEDKRVREQIARLLVRDGWPDEVAQLVAAFDPYDPNASASWFDPEWMFGITDGFDIVIGNPPYIQLQKDGGRLAKLYEKENYQTFARTGDIYTLFYEKGVQLLKPGGILCYITSNKWMRAGYGEKLRSFFTKYNPLLLIDLGPDVFENATVDTNILIIQKDKPPRGDAGVDAVGDSGGEAQGSMNFRLRAVTLQKQAGKVDIEAQVKQHGVLIEKLSKDAWFIGLSLIHI